MKTKNVHDLTRADLGKKVRYEFDGDSVTVGQLTSVAHYLSNNQSFFQIDTVQHQTQDTDAKLKFVDED